MGNIIMFSSSIPNNDNISENINNPENNSVYNTPFYGTRLDAYFKAREYRNMEAYLIDPLKKTEQKLGNIKSEFCKLKTNYDEKVKELYRMLKGYIREIRENLKKIKRELKSAGKEGRFQLNTEYMSGTDDIRSYIDELWGESTEIFNSI